MATAFAIGIGTTYAGAMPSIDLNEDTNVNGNLQVTGDITGQTIDDINAAIASLGAGCDDANIQHWDKIIFTPAALIFHPTQPNLSPFRVYDLKFMDAPNVLVDADQKVIDKLTSLGYTTPILDTIINVIDVDYDIVCIKP